MKTSELFKRYLQSEGFPCTIDEDGDVKFKYEGKTFYLTDSGKDELFFRIIMPNIYDVEEDERVKVLEACNEVTRDIKVVKAFIVNDSLWLSIEILIDTTPEMGDIVPRLLDILMGSYRRMADLLG